MVAHRRTELGEKRKAGEERKANKQGRREARAGELPRTSERVESERVDIKTEQNGVRTRAT